MSRTSCVIEGQTFVWETAASTKDASRAACVVYWLRGDADGARIEIGRLKKWRSGVGWVVHPRLGGNIRAREERKGLSTTRLAGIRYLLDLARSETTLSVFDKVRLRILREEGEIIRDLGIELVPVPPLAA